MLIWMFFSVAIASGQEPSNLNRRQLNSFVKKTGNKAANFNKRINKRTSKAISRLKRQEKRLEKSLSSIDKLTGLNNYKLGVDSLDFYKKLTGLKDFNSINQLKNSRYSGLLDTAKSLMKFLDGKSLDDKMPSEISNTLQEITRLEHGLGTSTQLENYMKNRKAELSSILSRYEPNHKFNKILKGWGKEYYYYGETVKNYHNLLDDPSRIQAKVFEVAKSIPAFKDFMKENGALASIFNGHELQDYSGLQTREQVNEQIKAQLAQLGSKGKDLLSGKLDEGKQILEKASEEFTGKDNKQEEKDFKPNSQKTKTLWQRLEIGTDFQFNRKTKELPMSVTTGFTVGFKLHDKFTVGTGIGANINAGKDLKHPVPAAQKVNFRSYSEYSLGREFYLRAGWERSFTKMVTRFESYNNHEYYQESALIGISKSLPTSIKVPLLKKKMSGKIMLMYDLLYKQHITKTPPVVFRVGYNF